MGRKLRLGDTSHELRLRRAGEGYWLVTAGGQRRVSLQSQGRGRFTLSVDGQAQPVWLVIDQQRIFAHLHGRNWLLELEDDAREDGAAPSGGQLQVPAPMPGTVLSVAVEPGDQVQPGQPMIVIESMKMETTITAMRNGLVATVHFRAGQSFQRNDLLISLAEPPPEQS